MRRRLCDTRVKRQVTGTRRGPMDGNARRVVQMSMRPDAERMTGRFPPEPSPGQPPPQIYRVLDGRSRRTEISEKDVCSEIFFFFADKTGWLVCPGYSLLDEQDWLDCARLHGMKGTDARMIPPWLDGCSNVWRGGVPENKLWRGGSVSRHGHPPALLNENGGASDPAGASFHAYSRYPRWARTPQPVACEDAVVPHGRRHKADRLRGRCLGGLAFSQTMHAGRVRA